MRSAYAVLDEGLELVELGLLAGDEGILDTVRRLRPRVVAIDAPLSLPLGLCCLEEGCGCRQVLPGLGRRAERALSREGISSYYVTKRTFVKGLIYRGIALRQVLQGEGYEVIEVYPYASKVRLLGKAVPPKRTTQGLASLRRRLLAHIPGLAHLAHPLTHDEYDALVAAHTAYLYGQGRTEAIGDPREGLIQLPGGIPE
jgi:predicted nuclease with RNAse H fold